MAPYLEGRFQHSFEVGDVVAVALSNGGCVLGQVSHDSACEHPDEMGRIHLLLIVDDNWPMESRDARVNPPEVEIATSSIVMICRAEQRDDVCPHLNPGWIEGQTSCTQGTSFDVAPLKAFQTHWRESFK